MSAGLFAALVLILMAEFVNGWTDAPNAIATVISTRVLKPQHALLMAAALNTAGAFAGTAVAFTIGTGIVKPEVINLTPVSAAMVGIVVWSTIAWSYGLPTSESHALVAGLSGAGLATAGPSVLLWEGWSKVLLGILFSTGLGFGSGMLLMVGIYRGFARRPPELVRTLFGRLQILSAAIMAFSHGSNDGQKVLGVATMGVGTAVGGWRIIRTMGLRLTKLEPVHGFAAETGAGLTILLASHYGIPLSTTHTINPAIIGVGSPRRLSAVRWGVVRSIVTAWILTFPICGAIAYAVALALS